MQLVVGRVARPHGVRGEVAVELRTDQPDARFAPGAVLGTDADGKALTVQAARWHRGRLLVRFAGADDREAAEALRGRLLTVDVPDDERPADPEEFYDHQLAGLAVRTVTGETVGTVTEVLHLPGQDMLAIRREDGGEVLVPFVSAIVPEVDLDGRRLLVDPPPGLLEEPGEA
jgi:16S rRNA processing protein RimM